MAKVKEGQRFRPPCWILFKRNNVKRQTLIENRKTRLIDRSVDNIFNSSYKKWVVTEFVFGP